MIVLFAADLEAAPARRAPPRAERSSGLNMFSWYVQMQRCREIARPQTVRRIRIPSRPALALTSAQSAGPVATGGESSVTCVPGVPFLPGVPFRSSPLGIPAQELDGGRSRPRINQPKHGRMTFRSGMPAARRPLSR